MARFPGGVLIRGGAASASLAAAQGEREPIPVRKEKPGPVRDRPKAPKPSYRSALKRGVRLVRGKGLIRNECLDSFQRECHRV